jgi:hypothetical protein
MRALLRFFRTPPLAMRIVVGMALVVEFFAFVVGGAPDADVVRDAAAAPNAHVVAGTLLLAVCILALHALLATFVFTAALLVRRTPWLSAALAIVPVALAWLGFRIPVGFSFATADVHIEDDTFLALLTGAMLHNMLAGLAGVIVLLALPFGLIRRSGAEGGRPASNSEAS